MKQKAILLLPVLFSLVIPLRAQVFSGLGKATLENVAAVENLSVALVPPPPGSRAVDPGLLLWIEDQITDTLASVGSSLTLLVRRDLDTLVQEQNLQRSVLYDTRRRAEFGRAVGANTFGFFDLIDWGDRYVVYLDLVRASTGELLSSERTVVRKTLLPGRYMDLASLRLEDLGEPDLLFDAVRSLVDGVDATTLAGRRVTLGDVQASDTGEELQRAVVKDLIVALFRVAGGADTAILVPDTEELLTAIAGELESSGDPDRMSDLIPRFWGATVLGSLRIENEAARRAIALSLRFIDTERGAYLPGAASREVDLAAIYQPLYLPDDYVVISSMPSGMPISIGGQGYGSTPVNVFGLEPGEHTVVLRGVSPYATTRGTIRVRPGSGQTSFHLEMARPRIRMRVVDSETGRVVPDPEIETTELTSKSGDFIVFSGLSTGAENKLEVRIGKEGYLRRTVVYPLNPDMESTAIWEVPITPLRERQVSVFTEPEGATVFIDNRFVGRTPLVGAKLETGDSAFLVRIQAPGWNTVNRTVEIEEIGSEGVLVVPMSRNVWLRSVPPGADLHLNGEHLGRTDQETALPAGPNRIHFRLGSFERDVIFDPSEQEDREVRVTVTRQRANIAVPIITNLDRVEIWVDNREAEARGGEVMLPEGPQRIRIARSGYAPIVRYLNVRPGVTIHAHMLSVDQQRRLGELQALVGEGRLDRVENDLVEFFNSHSSSPQAALSLMDYYVRAMEQMAGRFLTNQRQINRLARDFDELARTFRFPDPEAQAVAHYLHARYTDVLAQVHSGAIEYYGQAISRYTGFIELYRGGSGLFLDSGEERFRYEQAHYRRAVLAVDRYKRFYRGTTVEDNERTEVQALLRSYIQLPLPEKPAERTTAIRELLLEVQTQ